MRISNAPLKLNGGEIEVPWATADAKFETSSDRTLFTKGISPCIGISVIAPSRSGVMHVHPKADENRIRQQFNAMMNELPKDEKTEAYIRGGAGYNLDPKKRSENVVGVLQALVAEHGVKLSEQNNETLNKYDGAEGTSLATNPADGTVYRDVR